MSNIVFFKGHEFIDCETGQGYRLTEDALSDGIVRASTFEAINGAPQAEAGLRMPDWLRRQIWGSLQSQRAARKVVA